MGFLKLLLNIGIILAIKAIFCVGQIEISRRLSRRFVPIHYNICLTLYLGEENFVFDGESNVNIAIHQSSSSLQLHSKDLDINEMATTLISDMDTVYKPTQHVYEDLTNILILKFTTVLSPGLYTLKMKFTGNIFEAGRVNAGFTKFVYTIDKQNSSLVATHLKPNGARRIFPCWDEPDLKATFTISVKTHHRFLVLSNMPSQDKFFITDDMAWTIFYTTPIMSTYLVAITAMPMLDYNLVTNANGINIWCRSFLKLQVKFIHNIAEKVTWFLIEYTNSSEKVPKMDHVLIPYYPNSSLESWGLIFYNEYHVTYDIMHSINRKTNAAKLVAHELVQQWFGNLVTPSLWSFIWLSEGIATFLETYIINKIFKDGRMMDVFVIWDLQYIFELDISDLNAVTLQSTTDRQFSFEIYKKVAVLLRMLQGTITEEVFQKGLIKYLATHQFSSISPDDLWYALQNTLDESDVPHNDYRIKEMMSTWLDQCNYPEVDVTRNYTTGEVTISQKCYQKIGILNETTSRCVGNDWWIPITFATQSNPNFSNTVPSHWLQPNQDDIRFTIDPNDWIILNVQQIGYYRVNYDMTNWARISSYLHSENYTNIHILNRAQLISDLFASVMNERVGAGFLINFIKYLYQEHDCAAWYRIFEILTWLEKFFFVPEAASAKLIIKPLLSNLLRKTGYSNIYEDDEITKETRFEAIEWACYLDNKICQDTMTVKLNKYLVDPDFYEISERQKFMYCIGLMAANKTTWNKMLEFYINESLKKEKSTILKSLSCAQDPDIIINYLNIIAFNTSLFNVEQHFEAFKYIIEKHARDNIILDHVLTNIEVIKPKRLTTLDCTKLILSNIYSNDGIVKVQQFFEIRYEENVKLIIRVYGIIKERKDFLKKSTDAFKRKFHLGELET